MLPEFTDPKQRSLFKNIVYLGALAELLNIEFDVITGMVSTQYAGKEHLLEPNIRALEVGDAMCAITSRVHCRCR